MKKNTLIACSRMLHTEIDDLISTILNIDTPELECKKAFDDLEYISEICKDIIRAIKETEDDENKQ